MGQFSFLSPKTNLGNPSTMLRLTTLALSFSSFFPGGASMYFESRSDWGARPPKEAYTPITNPKGVKVHYLGELFVGIEHSQCAQKMRSTQDYHMDKSPENYFDIAYSVAVCQHGYVFDGRGAGHRSGANGNVELNANHYAVLAFLGNTGVTQPSQSQITGIQDAIAYFRRKGAGNEIKGHRDGYSTNCPGGALYNLVKDGTLDPGKLYDGGTHTVGVGETLKGISLKFNVPERYIIDVNKLKAPYALIVGDKLKIPARGVPLGSAPPTTTSKPTDPTPPTTPPTTPNREPFPGTAWFKSKPNSPIITAMGKRLVAEGCSKYVEGPGAQWSDADLASYKEWQKKLGFSGSDADGWPGKTSWDKLAVPTGQYATFPGVAFFKSNPNSPIITAMGKRLVAEGCSKYVEGPSPQWSSADKASYAEWQKKLGFSGSDADGWPGQVSWDKLKVPKV
ncbi:Uncharacterized protein BP5553_00712 [Venustampulla echinocandica]|uniref:LysM domain-containing protein n=1 Tax=Venustampulla echinocandica TaxID=2656787 RepID=A0A370TYX9_9HELO|nr:Uncharacterized protein BP5553_00712 [Venustampulla echinocandica]RDL40733.1 Uncharacterized protein BP5553_00712 [Venustampulla echinocandica]